MSFSANEVRLIGHLGHDPEIRRTQDGRPIANFSIATSEQWRDKATGERKEKTDWHRVVVFNENLAKIVEQYVKKGSHVYLVGKLRTRKWTDQGGQERYVTEVICEGFDCKLGLLGGRRDGVPPNDGADHDPSREPQRRPVPHGNSSGRPNSDMDDDIPF
ncbi:MAG: single-stranded DNA-binding protein [Bradyrhizobium sp.]|uniref:single-stranded DNA-binding protein n=1 Tax=Bradyrhizobium sp. TaxID=376 RepID=UPI003BF3BD15